MTDKLTSHVGMVFPPQAFDIWSPELVRLSGEKIIVMQTQMRLGADFSYELRQFPQTAAEVKVREESR